MPTFAFLIKNKKLGKNIMIDLSCRMDWWNIAPVAYNSIRNGSPGLNVRENVKEILEEARGGNARDFAFDKNIKIGQYPSYDFFDDGSFYILDVPGRAIGHIFGPARTTPDTFVFMGGDVCHFGGSYRPTQYVPLSATVPPGTALDSNRFTHPCPCSIFTTCHRDPPNARTSPFYSATQKVRRLVMNEWKAKAAKERSKMEI